MRQSRSSSFPAWTGQLLLAPGLAAYLGPLLPTGLHRHHAAQILLVPGGIDLVAGARPSVRVTAAIVPPHHPHALGSASPLGAVILVEPTSARGRRVPTSSIALALDVDVVSLRSRIVGDVTPRWVDELFALCGFAAPRATRRHPSIGRVQAAIEDRLVSGPLDAASLASVAGLSPGRLGHAFREHVGLPVRAYVKWKRLERAAQLFGGGCNIIHAAHEAGFSDAAHLSRTFRAMTGLAPSDLVGHVQWLTPPGAP